MNTSTMRNIFRIIFIIPCFLFCNVLIAQNDKDSTTRPTFAKFADDTDLDFQMRGSLKVTMPDGEEPRAQFRMDNFRWNVEGIFGKHDEFYYQFRQSFNANFKDNMYDGLLESIDYAYLRWRPFKHLSFTFGKQVFAIGGQEFWAPPVYVMQYSDFGGSLPCYQLGFTTTYHITDRQEICFQMANIRGRWNHEFLYGGFPEDAEPTNAPFLYTINWNGSFLEDHALEFRYSVSWGQEAKNKDLWIATMGQSYRAKKWGLYLDLIYSNQDLDINGIISRSAHFPDGVARNIENVQYTSIVAYFHVLFGKHWGMFVKGAREYGFLNRPYRDAPAGLCRTDWNAQASIQYMPLKTPNFRLFLHYNFYNLSPADTGKYLGIEKYNEHRLSVGIIYVLNVF